MKSYRNKFKTQNINTMKYILILLSVLVLSCQSARPGSKKQTSKEELAKFSISGDTIFYEGQYCARYTELEWEYYRGKKTLEISVEKPGGFDNSANAVMDFMRKKYPSAKIEVKLK